MASTPRIQFFLRTYVGFARDGKNKNSKYKVID